MKKERKTKLKKNIFKSGKEKQKFSFRRPMIQESEKIICNILNSSNPKSKENEDMKN